MRKRCFIIATLAFVLGIIFNIAAVPSSEEINGRISINKSMQRLDESAAASPLNEGRSIVRSRPLSLGPDPLLKGASLGSFTLAGVLLLVGFIAGPKKT